MNQLKTFLSKQALGFHFALASVVFTLLTVILYIANANHLYYTDFSWEIFFAIFGALVLIVGVVALPQFVGNKSYTLLLYIGAVLLMGYYGFLFINGRVETIAYVFASELESNNPFAQFATRQAIVTFVFFVLSWITALISSFFKVVKD